MKSCRAQRERGSETESKTLRNNTTISKGARNPTLLASFSKVLASVWGHMGQKCT